jgi:hypothetical protein
MTFAGLVKAADVLVTVRDAARRIKSARVPMGAARQEQAYLEEERRRAEAALERDKRRLAVDRELTRLRLLAGTALVGWLASVAVVAADVAGASIAARVVAALGWLLLLSAIGASFIAQGRVGTGSRPEAAPGTAGAASLWLLLAGLAATAASLLF